MVTRQWQAKEPGWLAKWNVSLEISSVPPQQHQNAVASMAPLMLKKHGAKNVGWTVKVLYNLGFLPLLRGNVQRIALRVGWIARLVWQREWKGPGPEHAVIKVIPEEVLMLVRPVWMQVVGQVGAWPVGPGHGNVVRGVAGMLVRQAIKRRSS